MAKAKHIGVWGIDIGQCALKAIRLENVDGQVTATAFDYVEYPKILSQPDADPDQLTREALEKFLSRNTLKGDLVAISVPGQSGLARFVKLPPVEEKKIGDIVRFEAKQQIPFPLEEVIWDFQKIGSGQVTDGFAMETEIGLFAMKKDMINRALQYFKDVHIEVNVVQMAPLALCNYVSYDLLKKGTDQAGGPGEGEEEGEKTFKKRCIVALDIGTDNSNLVITDGERIIWQRPIPQGGNHFTRALTKDLKLTFAKAEHIKRNATKSPDLKKILSSLKPVLTDFVGEVQRSLGYFTNTHRDAQVLYMIGLGNAFRLPGLQKFLSEKLQTDVRKLQKLQRLTGDSVVAAPAFSQNILSFPVAYGLALQASKLARLQTNLLPPDIQTERMVRAKKPWAVTAAASLLIGVVGVGAGYAMQWHSVNAKPITDAMDEAATVAGQITRQKGEVESKQTEVKQNEEAVRSIVAGQDERLDWILVNQFVNQCLPEPSIVLVGKFNGPVDPDKQPNVYLITDKNGQDQPVPLDESVVVLVNGQPTKVNELTRGTDVTVIDAPINLEAIDGRFSSDLKAFFTKLAGDSVTGKIDQNILRKAEMTEKDQAVVLNPPAETEKGWVMELRGYTYHKPPARSYVINTFLKRLQTLAQPPAGDKGTPAAADKEASGQDQVEADSKKTPWDRIIVGKISHAILSANYADSSPASPFDFKLIGTSSLPALVSNAPSDAGTSGATSGPAGVSPGGSGAMSGPGGSMGSGGGAAGDSWVSILQGGGTGAPGSMGSGGTGPRTGMTPPGRPMSSGSSGAGMPGPGSTGTSGTPATGAAGAAPPRFEFIMLFVWKEPTPSDDRMAKENANNPAGTAK